MTKDEFIELKTKWREDTIFHSNPVTIYDHPCYARIVAGGKDVVPFILEDLRDNGPEYWWDTLYQLTGIDLVVSTPVANGWRGINVEETCNKWVEWGKENKIIAN